MRPKTIMMLMAAVILLSMLAESTYSARPLPVPGGRRYYVGVLFGGTEPGKYWTRLQRITLNLEDRTFTEEYWHAQQDLMVRKFGEGGSTRNSNAFDLTEFTCDGCSYECEPRTAWEFTQRKIVHGDVYYIDSDTIVFKRRDSSRSVTTYTVYDQRGQSLTRMEYEGASRYPRGIGVATYGYLYGSTRPFSGRGNAVPLADWRGTVSPPGNPNGKWFKFVKIKQKVSFDVDDVAQTTQGSCSNSMEIDTAHFQNNGGKVAVSNRGPAPGMSWMINPYNQLWHRYSLEIPVDAIDLGSGWGYYRHQIAGNPVRDGRIYYRNDMSPRSGVGDRRQPGPFCTGHNSGHRRAGLEIITDTGWFYGLVEAQATYGGSPHASNGNVVEAAVLLNCNPL